MFENINKKNQNIGCFFYIFDLFVHTFITMKIEDNFFNIV